MTQRSNTVLHATAVFILGVVLYGVAVLWVAAHAETEPVGELDALPASIDLVEVPFFAQEDFQCGPAALATALAWSGRKVAPDDLRDQVYSPARKGTLPNDMIAATRRLGRLAYPIHTLGGLLRELAAGHPVIVLQDLANGREAEARWHFAVAVGYDRDAGIILLRSGRTARRAMSFDMFEASWQPGERWAMLVIAASDLPTSADEAAFIDAATGLEAAQQPAAAADAYEAAVKRWPGSLGAWVGLGNARYALHDLPKAERAFRRATEINPGSGSALNNLALVLDAQGHTDEAHQIAERAVAQGGPLADTFRATLNSIEGKQLGHAHKPDQEIMASEPTRNQASREVSRAVEVAVPKGPFDGHWKGKAIFDGGARCTGFLSIDMEIRDSEITGRWHVEGNPVGAGDYRMIGSVNKKGQLIDTTASRGYVGHITGWLDASSGRGGFTVGVTCLGTWQVTRTTAEQATAHVADGSPGSVFAAGDKPRHAAEDTQPPSITADTDLQQRLQKLRELVDLGLISPEEEQKKRAQLLTDF